MRPEEYFKEGVNYFKNGSYQLSLDYFTKAEIDSPEEKYPDASFNKGNLLRDQFQDYYAALESYTKAEKDSPEEKFPLASLNKGVLLADHFQDFKAALDSYTKAEKDSPEGKYPDASYNKGVLLADHFQDFKAALDSYTKAEKDCPEEKYPDASLNKGTLLLHHFQNYYAALESYTKAEKDSPEEKFPLASLNKGVLLADHFQDFKAALDSYTKAEKDSPEGKYPDASYNKGVLLADHFQDFKAALDSYTKAEKDCPEEKFPLASLNKGTLLIHHFQDFKAALDSYNKAEKDSPEERYPDASYNKGNLLLHHFQDYKAALDSYNKAEKDSPEEKFPRASSNKGILLLDHFQDYKAALDSYNKAEKDSPEEKFPDASHNKGTLYYTLNNYEASERSYSKAIEDSENRFNPKAYHGLSLALYNLNKYQEASDAAVQAVSQNDRFESAFQLLFDRFSKNEAKNIYHERVKYLALHKRSKSEQALGLETSFGKHLYLQESEKTIYDYFLLYCLFTEIALPGYPNLKKADRLRLAYLVAYHQKAYHYVFYIIDELLDTVYPLTDMDQFFFLLSAYKIGEPVSQLLSLSNEEAIEPDSQFYQAYLELGKKVNAANENKQHLDPYLLNINPTLPEFSNVEYEIEESLLAECLEAILQDGKYKPPISKTELNGLVGRILEDTIDAEITDKIEKSQSWQNFALRLEQSKFDNTQFDNIIDCLTNKVPYRLLLYKLFLAFDIAGSEDEKHNIAVLQALVMVYAKGESALAKGIATNTSNTILSSLSDLGATEVLSNLIIMGIGVHLGLSLACSLAIGKATSIIKDRISLNSKINHLKSELRNE